MTTEWRNDMHCWMPNERGDEPFLAGQVLSVDGAKGLKVRIGGAEQTVDPERSGLLAGNQPGSTASDHTALLHMNEASVLENSRLRFLADDIYTLVGTILVAINPFAPIPIYGPEVMTRYDSKELGDSSVEAHVYAMGEAAYRTMLRLGGSAALVMSGESGAGKTETTKHLMKYIAWCSNKSSGGEGGEGGLAEELASMIISTSPLLEAFGNAKTVRNNNSSRFGKMMRLHFTPSGQMAGAFVKTYLLEKIRVVAITSPERNYHIFYQLLAARPGSLGQYDLAWIHRRTCRC